MKTDHKWHPRVLTGSNMGLIMGNMEVLQLEKNPRSILMSEACSRKARSNSWNLRLWCWPLGEAEIQGAAMDVEYFWMANQVDGCGMLWVGSKFNLLVGLMFYDFPGRFFLGGWVYTTNQWSPSLEVSNISGPCKAYTKGAMAAYTCDNMCHGEEKKTVPGWWFGTCFIFPSIGNVIIPTDELICFRGVPSGILT